MQKVSILIPVFNEKDTLEILLDKVEQANFAGLEKEIILVDDCSVDGTIEIMKNLSSKYKVLFHEKNQGKGAAIKTAIKEATGDFVVIQDADLEYLPDDYDKLLPILINDEADVVYGSRFKNEENLKNFMWKNKLANKFLTFLANICLGTKLTDMETCYKAFKKEIIQGISIKSNRFDFEPEITAKLARKRVRFKEVSISYFGRGHDEGKKITWKDGLYAIFAIIKFRFFD